MGDVISKSVGDGRVMIYAQLLPLIRDRARELGYAIGLHGSMVRDLDLIACPWTDAAASAEELVEAVRGACGGFVVPDCETTAGWTRHSPVHKPHGRLAWSICFGGKPFIDLSVMPRTEG